MAKKTNHTITIAHQRYHIQSIRAFVPKTLRTRLTLTFDEAFIPVTSIDWNKTTFDDKDLQQACQLYEESDDVWSNEFLRLVVLLRASRSKCEVLSKDTICINNINGKVPRGPLVIEKATGYIFKVSKLVQDTHAAFVSGIVPTPQHSAEFSELRSENGVEIALPSRLYYLQTVQTPFAGLRIGVKDTISLKGLRTGFGSQAWHDTYGPEETTAPCVQKLIDAGAVIVGKLVSSEFAEGVDVGEWTQGVCPYNPRGDGVQKPSSSSTGSAVAAAAYEWLDVAIGTDTGGSIRHPAGVNGLYGQRPTTGSIDLTGVLGATDLFNTVGIFARSVDLFTSIGSFLIDSIKKTTVQPRQHKYNLLYPTRSAPGKDVHHGDQHRWFPHPEADSSTWTEAEKQIEAVVSKMEEELGCERIPFNIYDVWSVTPPKGQPRSLDEATGRIYGDITTSSACATGIDQFLTDYAVLHDGQQPKISEIVQRRLEYGRTIPNDQIAAALEATAAFKKWMESTLFGSYDQDATTLMVFPQSCGRPAYRDEYTPCGSNLFNEIFSIYAFGFLCGCPDYTIPVGEVPYQSRITQQTEYLPVSLSLVGKPGTDGELFDVLRLLHAKNIVSDVMAGSRMYSD